MTPEERKKAREVLDFLGEDGGGLWEMLTIEARHNILSASRKALALEESGLVGAAHRQDDFNRRGSISDHQYRYKCHLCAEIAFELDQIEHDPRCHAGFLSKALTAYQEAK